MAGDDELQVQFDIAKFLPAQDVLRAPAVVENPGAGFEIQFLVIRRHDEYIAGHDPLVRRLAPRTQIATFEQINRRRISRQRQRTGQQDQRREDSAELHYGLQKNVPAERHQ